MYQAIVFLPLLGSMIAGLFGRVIGRHNSEIVPTALLFISAALSGYAFYDVAILGHGAIVSVAPWITSGDFNVDWTLRIDTLTAVMLVVVTGVSSLVHLYSIGYMEEDPHTPRFFSYLSLFTFAMLMLVTANNLLQMFFGWEGVGLASYLLIGFWYLRPSANAAAIKAFIVNRVGDFGFALGVFGCYAVFGSLDFNTIFQLAPTVAGKTFPFAGHDFDILTTLCILLFIGAMGKSAQIGLHTWLPDAMEGPTPVSALIHAATMVTAGVFLVCRMSPLYEMAPVARDLVAIVGATTAFFAASVGLFQNDIKRVVAYSTCSQLGYMFFGAGVGAYGAGMFHLFTHASFKALLFLGSGSVIHAMHHEQDMRRMGGLKDKIPYTYAMMIVGTIALTGLGIPFTPIGGAGFYSKDAILEAAFNAHTNVSEFAFTLGIVAAAMTSFYSWRLIFMTFHGHPRGDHHVHEHAHESPSTMMVPLVVLSIGALLTGALFAKLFVGGAATDFWKGAVALAAKGEAEVPVWVGLAPFVAAILGVAIAYYYYILHPELPPQMPAQGNMSYTFLYNKWYFDELYDLLFVRPAKRIGRFLWKVGDGLIIDGLGPDGVAARVLDVTKGAIRLQSGYVYHYAFAMLFGVAALVTWFLFSAGRA
ncbi:MAG TPA: NADH-quinone oxidoreductase subunit L [Micropepsaceae bacterium]|nr:NADH-quinone oxidoreductase subunit L [Micropepsaceae bacterium]